MVNSPAIDAQYTIIRVCSGRGKPRRLKSILEGKLIVCIACITNLSMN